MSQYSTPLGVVVGLPVTDVGPSFLSADFAGFLVWASRAIDRVSKRIKAALCCMVSPKVKRDDTGNTAISGCLCCLAWMEQDPFNRRGHRGTRSYREFKALRARNQNAGSRPFCVSVPSG